MKDDDYQYTVEDIERKERDQDSSPSRSKVIVVNLLGLLAIFVPVAIWQFVSFEVAVIFVLTIVWLAILSR